MEEGTNSSSTACYHAVRFYENDRSLSQIVADFVGDGLVTGEPAIIVATPAHRAAILRELVAKGVNVVQLQRSDELMLLDAEETLSTFMADGQPDDEKFRKGMTKVIQRACRARPDCTVRIYGEMVDVLWKDGNYHAAIRLEVLWNQLANAEAFSLLCGYAMGHFYKEAALHEVCGQHTHLVSADGKLVAVA
jgi:hypothetical protein